VVVDAEVEKTKKDTPGSERRSVLKKSLTGPTLLEMSGYATYQALQIALFSVHWTGAEKTKNPATSDAIPQIQAPTTGAWDEEITRFQEARGIHHPQRGRGARLTRD
jgi:hypothetical protein